MNLEIPPQKTFADVGLNQFGQSPLQFTGAGINRRARTHRQIGVHTNVVEEGSEGWLQKGKSSISLIVGQDIQGALDQVFKNGGGQVSLAPGTYNVRKDLFIPSGVALRGAGTFITIVDFGGEAYSIRMEGSDPYSTGTVDVTQDSTTVIGTNTVWTDEMVGQGMLIDGDWYTIEAVVSATEITLTYGFSGVDQTGLTYVIATINSFPIVADLTVQNSSTNLIEIKYCFVPKASGVARYGGENGIDARDSVGVYITDGEGAESVLAIFFSNVWSFYYATDFLYSCSSDGFQAENSGDATMLNFGFSNNGGCGAKWTNVSKVSTLAFTIDTNTSHGVELVSGCDDNTFNSGTIHTNDGDGIKLTATSDRNSVAQLQFLDNGGYGINVAVATCDDNIILGNVITGNFSGNVNDSGTTTLIRSNRGVADN